MSVKTNEKAYLFRSGSALFLMEQLIVILIFAVCAAICVRIFAEAYMMASDSRDLSNALIVAESVAESYKAVGGDADSIAKIFSGSVNENTVSVYYDEKWQVCGKDSAVYIVTIINRSEGRMALGDISVKRTDGDEIIALTSAVRRDSR